MITAPNHGSTFKVLFPATPAALPVADKPAAVKMAAASDRLGTVLVIDDEDIVRRTAKNTLERHGYEVVLAGDGYEGVEKFRCMADKVNVVLLDLTMPEMNGEEVLRKLKFVRSDVKVILSSGFNEVEVIQRFTGKGLAGFIQKPYAAAALLGKVRTAVESGKKPADGTSSIVGQSKA